MAKVDPKPSEEILQKRREKKYIIDPKDVELKDDLRARKWAFEIVKKHESVLSNQVKHLHIVARDEVKAEDIDIKNIYPYKNLHWIIYRWNTTFRISLLSGNKVLFTSGFAKI